MLHISVLLSAYSMCRKRSYCKSFPSPAIYINFLFYIFPMFTLYTTIPDTFYLQSICCLRPNKSPYPVENITSHHNSPSFQQYSTGYAHLFASVLLYSEEFCCNRLNDRNLKTKSCRYSRCLIVIYNTIIHLLYLQILFYIQNIHLYFQIPKYHYISLQFPLCFQFHNHEAPYPAYLYIFPAC